MDYKQLCADPLLRDLPFKIELDEHGTILMTPASNRHGTFQANIGHELLARMQGGKEVWLCSEEGDVEFHSYEGPIPQSRLVPDMPAQILHK